MNAPDPEATRRAKSAPGLAVLVVDDSDDDAELLLRALRKGGYEIEAARVDTAATLARELERRRWDLVLSDWTLPTMKGPQILSTVRDVDDSVPFVFVSGTVGEAAAVRAMRDGAQDYIMKDNLSRLVPAIERELREFRRRQENLRRETERASLEARFQRLLAVAPDAVIATDENEVVSLFNLGAERIFGYEAHEVLGRPLEMLLPGQAERRRRARELAASGLDDKASSASSLRPGQSTFEGQRKGGRRFPIEGTLSELIEGRRTSLLLILRDVSERKRDEKELQLLQRVTLDASAAGTTESALSLAIARVCEAMRWSIGEVWEPDEEDPALLVNVARHCREQRVQRFHEDSPRELPEDSLVGRALRSRRARYAADLPAHPRFLRKELAAELGLRSALAVPVVGTSGPLAVMLFIDREPIEDHRRVMRLMRRVASQLAIVLERKQSEERLEYLAHHDALTGLPNRVLFMDRLHQALADARRRERMLAVGFLDLDRFKGINDTLGHAVGDRLLQHVARILPRCVRAGDSVARVSGDEFSFVLTALHDAREAARVARRILGQLSRPVEVEGHQITAGASLGLTLFPDDGTGPDALVRNADIAMYHAKQRGRGNYQFFSADMAREVKERLDLETALRGAVERDEFVLHYQPILDLAGRSVCGVEALLRWRTPDGRLLGPDQFISIAEESGVIAPLGAWVLRTACEEWCEGPREFGEQFRLAVNVSPRQFQGGGLDESVAEVLASTGFDPRALDLEITEGVLLEHEESILGVMRALGRHGVHFTIDDFGTGYSNLHYIKDLPIRRLKVDRSFVREIPADENAVAIVSAIISMAHSLGLDVVAEGVETLEQLEVLTSRGCRTVQGHLYCRARPADELRDWIRRSPFVG